MVRLLIRNPDNRLLKISMTKLLQGSLGLRLDSAKHLTDEIVSRGEIVVELPTIDQAQLMIDQVGQVGAYAEILD